EAWRGGRRHNDIDLEPNELGRVFCVVLTTALCPTILDGDGATLNPAEFAQPLNKSGNPLALNRRVGTQKPDGRRFTGLPARRERPCSRRAADQRDELAPSPVKHGASRALGDRKGWAPNGSPAVGLNRSESCRRGPAFTR